MIYLLMLGVSLFFSVYAERAKPYPQIRGSYGIFAVLSALPFLLVTIFRYRVGTDWTFVYEPFFYYVNHGIDCFSEAGFNLLYKMVGFFTDDSWWIFAIVGFLTIVFFFLAIYEQSPMIPFSILLFFISDRYFTSLNQIRQMLAMSIFVYSLKYVYKRRMIPYLVWNVIGAAIHTSSWMYLPLYFLYGIKATPRRSILFLCASVAGYPLLVFFLLKLLAFTSYSWYLDSAFNQNNFYLIGFAVSLLFTLIHVDELTDWDEADLSYHFMTNLQLLSTVLLLFSVSLSQVQRVSEGLNVVRLFSFPIMLKKEEGNHRKRLLLLLLIVGIYSVVLFYNVYVNKWYGVLPYQTIFSR